MKRIQASVDEIAKAVSRSSIESLEEQHMHDEILTASNFEYSLELLLEEQKRRTRYLWKQRDGRLIDVREMSDIHLSRTIAMLKRKQALHEMAFEAMS